jgi:GT2 family glycosyltransferase
MPLAPATLASLVTVAVVPRERFSHTPATLDSIHRHTPPEVRVVVVDGYPPAPVAMEIAARSSARGYRLIRCDRFLSPNQARNIAVSAVATPYVVFCDNDLLVTPNWLDPLVTAAEEMGADAVGPIYLFDEPEKGAVHMAGGELIWSKANGETLLDERQLYSHRHLAEIRHELHRGVCDYVEFHCMLVPTIAKA